MKFQRGMYSGKLRIVKKIVPTTKTGTQQAKEDVQDAPILNVYPYYVN
jgi:hypothetical protein